MDSNLERVTAEKNIYRNGFTGTGVIASFMSLASGVPELANQIITTGIAENTPIADTLNILASDGANKVGDSLSAIASFALPVILLYVRDRLKKSESKTVA